MVVSADLEKRVFQRMIIDKHVTVRYDDTSLDGICRDLSANGMSIEVEKDLIPQSSQVNICLSATDTRIPPLEATAKIVRIIASSDNSTEILGLEFLTVC